MKIKFVINLVLLFLPSAVWAQSPKSEAVEQLSGSNAKLVIPIQPYCEVPRFIDIEKMYQPQCKEQETPELECACFKNAAISNDLLASLMTYDTSAIQVEEMRQENRKKFMKIYEQMTVQANAQLSILGLDEKDEKFVGCTPKEISSGVTENVNLFNKAREQEIIDSYKKRTKPDCKKDPSADGCGVGGFSMSHAGKHNKRDLNQDLACRTTLGFLSSDNGRARLQAALNGISEDMRKNNVNKKEIQIQLDAFESILKSLESGTLKVSAASNALYALFVSSGDSDNCSRFSKYIPNDPNVSSGGVVFDSKTDELFSKECSSKDQLCQVFALQNRSLLNNLARNNSRPTGSQCVSFAEFKTFKSMPSAAFLDGLATNSNPGNLLLTPKDNGSDLEKAQINFLRSNPMIAKMAINKDVRDRLVSELKTLAGNLKGVSDSGKRLSTYLKFMKEKIGPLSKSKEMMSSNEFICKNLIDSFSAINVAQDIPNVRERFEVKGDVFREIENCKDFEHNLQSKTNLEQTLKASPIFSLAQDDYSDEKEKDDFNDFNLKNCEGFEQKCGVSKTETCRQEYLAKSAVGGEATALKNGNVNSSLTASQINRIGNRNSSAHQNTEFKKWWHKKVEPSLSEDFIAERGKEDDFRYSQERNQQTVSNTKVPERYSAPPLSDPSPAPSVASQSTQVPSQASNIKTQDVPAFSQLPAAAQKFPDVSLTEQGLKKSQTIEELIPGFSSRTPKEQDVLLGKIKSLTEKSPEKAVLEEKFDLAKEEARVAALRNENNKIVAPAGVAASAPLGNVVGTYPTFNPPSSGGIAQASIKSAPRPKPNSDRGSRDQALNQINEQRDLANGRSPASLLPVDTAILIQSSTTGLSGLGPNVDARNVLEVLDLKTYLEIGADADKLAAYIHSQVVKSQLDLTKLRDQDVISIRNPTVGSDSYMAFKVTKLKSKGGLAFEYLRDPVILPPRKSKLDDLKRELR